MSYVSSTYIVIHNMAAESLFPWVLRIKLLNLNFVFVCITKIYQKITEDDFERKVQFYEQMIYLNGSVNNQYWTTKYSHVFVERLTQIKLIAEAVKNQLYRDVNSPLCYSNLVLVRQWIPRQMNRAKRKYIVAR